ncbi:putative RNA methyltransferase [Luteococcus japonicus]|uniref:Ribosomal RNA large subunit methyltransferase A \|nr:methyltransferase domain-containing protein [Luteococcus japonicus]SJN45856.1 Ribosomal RNA large subunit methyltransferase A \
MTQTPMPASTGGIAACPICHGPLAVEARELWCDKGHRFDKAREGFVNLLRPGKSRKAVIGDDADMVADRRRFLDRGHYQVLSEGIAELVRDLDAERPVESLLDVGCGEGTFTAAMLGALADDDSPAPTRMAFDISRPAVKVTARRAPAALTCVASVIDMPVLDHSVDVLTSIMAPLHEAEFARVIRPGGRIVVVSPGDSHLAQLRQVLYPRYRPHDEQVALTESLDVVEQRRFTSHVHLGSAQELHEVWGMTPYRWNTPLDGQERFAKLTELDVDVHFVAAVFRAV